MDLTEVRHFDVQVGQIKLSTAMRLGALMRPQGFFRPFNRGMSCALGAAWEGMGHPYDPMMTSAEIRRTLGTDRVSVELILHVGHGITSLNDTEGWTRERIADLIAALGY